MRKLLILLLIVSTSALANPLKCGVKPIPPAGCDYFSARCVCDARGNCQWIFDC